MSLETLMKIITILTVLSLAPIALAHPDHDPKPDHPADHPEHPGDHPEHPSDGEGAKNAEEAIALLGKVHEAYKNASAIQETVTITMPAMMPGEDLETMEVSTWLGADSGQIIAAEEMTATWVDGKFYLTIGEKEDAYIEQEATSFSDGLEKATGGEGMPGLWTVSMREDDTIDDWLATFSMGMPGTELVGVTPQTQEDGTEVDVIELKTMMGGLSIAVTKENKINNVVMIIEQPGMPTMKLTSVSQIEFVKEVPPISFEAGDRTKYASIAEMFGDADATGAGGGESPLTGKVAPDFTLPALDGSGDVTLSSLNGSVVVLDFWATWCPPCKKGLPFLNEFDVWTQKEGLNVKVFAVDVWERGDAETIQEKVKKFWAENKYTTTVLMASGSDSLTKEYGVSGIPTTVIIGTDGKVIETHVGFSPSMVDTLKESVKKALGDSAKKPDHPDHPSDHPDHPSDHPDHPND